MGITGPPLGGSVNVLLKLPVADTVVVPERVVHVRIGAIEIHGAPAPAFAPAAPAPAPIVPSGESGFDRYERLRSYAAWER